MEKLLKSAQWFIGLLAKAYWPRTRAIINGGVYYELNESEHDKIRELLSKNYLIIFTRRKTYLLSYLILLASSIIGRSKAHYSHVLMNVEGDLDGHIGFQLIEATKVGVHYSTFMEVFDCDSVALLAPRGVSIEEWTKVLDKVKSDLGKGYDTLFDITNDQKVSCIELIYWGLKALPDFEQRFPKLVAAINGSINLTPQMLYDTGELDIVFEVRH